MERCVEYILTPAASNGGREESEARAHAEQFDRG